jgi:glycyl-tRNA synthetase beta chain
MEFLFEIGLEEVPARMIAGAEEELRKRAVALFQRERLIVGEDWGTISHSTPRRLAVRIWGVRERQEDLSEEVLGPAVKIAYPKGKDAEPGPAALAFARKSSVDVAALKIVETPKGEYIAATSVKPGKSASEVIAAELPKELAGIYWAKNMYWRPGKPERFVRPVRWMVALLGDDIVPVSFGGYEAGRKTYGHRVLFGDAAIEVASPASYVEQLSAAFAMADVELRRHTIRKALDRVCRTIPDTRWREDHELVDKMTHMTEWPSVIAGAFEPEYLELPEEVLVTVMRDHQNYFAVESKDGKLAPHFLAVLNTVADEAGEAVIRHGNERVLRARFNDARFFWEFDQRVLLKDRVALLENVTFQKDLGSYAAKSERVRLLCARLAGIVQERGFAVDAEALNDAARLAKTDLTTELVKEFTELQGEIGGLYARRQGFSQQTSDAIYDQYRPASMEDRIPRTAEGQLLAIADKADTIAGMFGLGLEPTGSKDPFALRRAANGIVKILAESQVPLKLPDILAASGVGEADFGKVWKFFKDRLEFYLRETKGQAYDVVKAVLAPGSDDVRDTIRRAEAVTEMRASEDFAAVAAAFKRIKNILARASEDEFEFLKPVDPGLFTAGPERELAEKGLALILELAKLDYVTDPVAYPAALELIATLRPQVDSFFETVMVMDPDAEVRANRLALLKGTVTQFSFIADFSEIVAAG